MDFYRYTPAKFIEQTLFGALISLAVVVFGLWLSFHEWNVIFNDELKSEIIFDNLYMPDLPIYMDISVFNVPCEIVDLRFTSKKGKDHSVQRYEESAESLAKSYNFSFGKVFVESSDAAGVKEKMDKKIGCRIRGQFYMHFLSNHFHVGYGNLPLLQQVSMMYQKAKTTLVMDLSHKVHQITFGTYSVQNALMVKSVALFICLTLQKLWTERVQHIS